jgi:radical SAM superfamily enzyme with C-terminal helix-hairpin-helix motif
MLERVCPNGTVLKDAFTELKIGRVTFARQIGTYPLLIGIQHDVGLNRFYDLKVTAHGSRSITAVEHPLDVNNCGMSALESLPGVGKKRAARIIRGRPYSSIEGVANALDEAPLAESIADYLTYGEYPEAHP